jgi:hypothetical protein
VAVEKALPQALPARSRPAVLAHPVAAAIGLWAIAATIVSLIAYRVTDWYVMTDELVYERLALNIARTGSVLPRIHGTSVRSLDQLYPLLIAPLFRDGTVAVDLRQAHVLGAIAMTSACIPAFLLARRVCSQTWAAWCVALASVVMPWLVYSSFLLTEPVAYPVFLWALLAVHCSVVAPSPRADVVALLALAAAFLARTELVALVVVLPLAIVLHERALGRSVRRHPLLTGTYAVLAVWALVFVASGGDLLRLSIYGQQIPATIRPADLVAATTGHLAQLAFGLGILPFVVAFAWLLANSFTPAKRPEAHAFACVGAVTIVVLTVEVAKFDLGLGSNVVYDRYLFYLVPIVVLGFVCALLDERWPRWSLIAPAILVAAGFALRLQESFTWSAGRVDPDSPISIYYHPLVELLGSRAAVAAGLAVACLALTGLFLLVAGRPLTAPVLVGLLVALLAAETGYGYVRLFRPDGYSNRPLTAEIPASAAWVDSLVGPSADVTEIPYHVSSDYLVTEQYWRDLEFWNKAVDREAQLTSAPYTFTGSWFPKLPLGFDLRNGKADRSPTRYVVQSVTDTRFALAGTVISQTNGAQLVRARRPWQASFVTLGTYDDGWLRPGAPATVRVYPVPGQRRPRIHFLSLQVWAPPGIASRPFQVRTNLIRYSGAATNTRTTFVNALPVCVPASGHTDVAISATGASTIPGDLSSYASSLGERLGTLYLADASISDNLGGPC